MARKNITEIARRVLGAIVVTGLLVAGIVFYSVAPTPDPPVLAAENDDPSEDTGEDAGGDTDESGATVTVQGPDTAVTPEEAIPTTGPGVDEPGIMMLIQPTATEGLLVSEQVRLPEGMTSITLAPPDVSRAGKNFAGLAPVATNVQVTAGNQPLVVPDGEVSESITLDVPSGNQYEVSYELEGAVVRSLPSTARRSLASISPLFAEAPPFMPVVIVAAGTSVLGLSCPLLKLSERACGEGTALAVQTGEPLNFQNAIITLQLDLPKV